MGSTSEKAKKTWGEISPAKKAVGGIGGVVQMALLAAALNDLRKRSPDQVNGPRAAWAAASFVNFVGPVAYFVFGRKR
jgi:hypothetical protein